MLQRLQSDPDCGTCGLAREPGVVKSTSLGKILTSPRAARNAQAKLAVVLTASTLHGEQLGAYSRAQGVVDAELAKWRAAMINGLEHTSVTAVREAPQAGAMHGGLLP